MARDKTPASRLIDNDIYKDERFLNLGDPLIQLAYVAALGQVDACGNLIADPLKLRQLILPGHALTGEDVCTLFNTFVEAGLAFYYERKGRLYIHFLETSNKLYIPPVYPLPEGLSARKPDLNRQGKRGGRFTAYRIYDEVGNECDSDGEPLDPNTDRVAPVYTCIYRDIRAVYTCISEKKGKERNVNEISFPSPSLPEAGACLEGTPAPAEDILPSSEEQRQAFLDELTALKGDDHAE